MLNNVNEIIDSQNDNRLIINGKINNEMFIVQERDVLLIQVAGGGIVWEIRYFEKEIEASFRIFKKKFYIDEIKEYMIIPCQFSPCNSYVLISYKVSDREFDLYIFNLKRKSHEYIDTIMTQTIDYADTEIWYMYRFVTDDYFKDNINSGLYNNLRRCHKSNCKLNILYIKNRKMIRYNIINRCKKEYREKEILFNFGHIFRKKSGEYYSIYPIENVDDFYNYMAYGDKYDYSIVQECGNSVYINEGVVGENENVEYCEKNSNDGKGCKEKGDSYKEEKKLNIECKICYNDEVTTLFKPCSHLVTCYSCALDIWTRFGKCSICKENIIGVQRVYF